MLITLETKAANMIKNRKAWIKRHGFTDGTWRLEDEERARKARLERRERNAQVAQPLRAIVNQISECPPWPLWQYPDLDS